jgi:putative ABC transport system ATP-binding protein
MIRLKQIELYIPTSTRSNKRILGPLDLTIANGDWIIIVGGNGAGKSTLLNTIAGTYKPSHGSIHIAETDVTRWTEYKRAQLLARVFQDPGIFPDLTIEENMALAHTRTTGRSLISRGVNNTLREQFRRALQTLKMGLEDRLYTKVSDLSGGQRQALSLIMATLQPSQALLLDEHTSALDPRATTMVMELTKKLIVERNLTAVMVTHSLHDALAYGNRILVLQQGRIAHDINAEQKKKLTYETLMNLL